MQTAALAMTAAMPTAAAFARAVRGDAGVGCAIVFLQNDTSAHACEFVSETTQRRQIN
jgi:hypothetical protein